MCDTDIYHHIYIICYSVVSLPRLVDFDWRVDVKTASDSSRVAVPSCVLQLQVTNGAREFKRKIITIEIEIL